MKLPAAASVVLSAGIIILVLSTAGHWVIAGLTASLALVWLIGLNRGWSWSYDAGFLTLVVAAAWGLSRQAAPVWMLVAVVLALIGWDLSRFLTRLAATTQEEQLHLVQTRHIRHLALVSVAILLAMAAGLSVQVQLNLGQSILLGLVLVMSLVWLLQAVQRERSS